MTRTELKGYATSDKESSVVIKRRLCLLIDAQDFPSVESFLGAGQTRILDVLRRLRNKPDLTLGRETWDAIDRLKRAAKAAERQARIDDLEKQKAEELAKEQAMLANPKFTSCQLISMGEFMIQHGIDELDLATINRFCHELGFVWNCNSTRTPR